MIDLDAIDERVARLQDGDSNDEEIDGITEMLRELQVELARIYEELQWMADYKLTGTEQTLHIDFIGKAQELLGR